MTMPRHFRIAHVNESADEGSDLIVPTGEWDTWLCHCGTENPGDWGNCLYCNMRRGAFVCRECGHRNPAIATECEECGHARPEE